MIEAPDAPDSRLIRFDGQVAIVTGAGRGLGRRFALALAARGAKVVVNGRGSRNGEVEKRVVTEIETGGGEAVAIAASVTEPNAVADMAAWTIDRWGHVDILVNNAGFVRDRSFAKLELEDFRAVIDVHLNGAANCTKAVWKHMLDRRYGRVIMVSSSSGLAGNFGQAAYSAAKMGMIGLMNTLGLEGGVKNVHVNCIAPVGATEMNAGLFTHEVEAVYAADKVAPGVVFLASERAPNRVVLLGGGGSFERAYTTFTRGVALQTGSAEELAEQFDRVSDRHGEIVPESAQAQSDVELANLGVLSPRSAGGCA
jgi:NAD(P)-dependent dehydrogenase (short-subunit alcohol dehydrogenase family)